MVSARQCTQLSWIHILLICFPLLPLNLNLCPVTTVINAHTIVIYGMGSSWRLLLWGESPPPWMAGQQETAVGLTVVIYSAAASRQNPLTVCVASFPGHAQGTLEGKPRHCCSSQLSLRAGWPPGELQMRAIPVPHCPSAKVPGEARPTAPACRTPAQPLLKILVVQVGHPALLLRTQQWHRGWDLLWHRKRHPGSRSDELQEGTGIGTVPLTIADRSRGHRSAELWRHGRGPAWDTMARCFSKMHCIPVPDYFCLFITQ